jgi:chromosome segregation ATPase
VAGASHLSYTIVDSVNEIDTNAADASKYIYLVKNGDSYDEYMVINNKLERVGDWNTSLDNYVTKTEFSTISTKVDDLESTLNSNKSEISTIQSSISSIETAIDDLETELNSVKANVNSNSETVSRLEEALEAKVDLETYNAKIEMIDEEIVDLKTAMTWKDLSD